MKKDFEKRPQRGPEPPSPMIINDTPTPPPSPTPKGEISKSMGIDTKPAHRFDIDGFWVLLDPQAPIELVIKLRAMLAYIKAYEEEVLGYDLKDLIGLCDKFKKEIKGE